MKSKDSVFARVLKTRRPFNLAHVLTSIRVALTPLFLVAIETGRQQPDVYNTLFVVGLFLVICASDYYDGPLARTLGLNSDVGKVFDNLADITFLLVTLSYLVYWGVVPWWIPTAIALAFGQYTLDSWLLSGRSTSVALVSNPIGHWAGVLNFLLTGVMALHATLQQQLLAPLLYRSLIGFWVAYLLLAIGVRLRFFLRVRYSAAQNH